jgi:hypothetical protein
MSNSSVQQLSTLEPFSACIHWLTSFEKLRRSWFTINNKTFLIWRSKRRRRRKFTLLLNRAYIAPTTTTWRSSYETIDQSLRDFILHKYCGKRVGTWDLGQGGKYTAQLSINACRMHVVLQCIMFVLIAPTHYKRYLNPEHHTTYIMYICWCFSSPKLSITGAKLFYNRHAHMSIYLWFL